MFSDIEFNAIMALIKRAQKLAEDTIRKAHEIMAREEQSKA